MNVRAIACLLALTTLTACGESTPGATPTPPASTPTPSPTPTQSPTPTLKPLAFSSKGPLRIGPGITKPKTTLRFGQPAIVPVEYSDLGVPTMRGVLSIVARPPSKAPASLVKALAADFRPAKGQSVYYIPILITNVSTGDLTGYRGTTFVAKLRSGRETPYQIGVGGNPACDPTGGVQDLPTLGSTARTCVVAAASPKDPLAQLQYVAAPYGHDDQQQNQEPDFNDQYDLGAITWH
ncbi:hypothetical protein ACFCV3_01460 [Kribbella sp. NPDC056345]|uniref:hypothetical protein n=1 Tax=Kribbella sp. NPDC056345 TaxID=3345789 RepID=UPI0035E05020